LAELRFHHRNKVSINVSVANTFTLAISNLESYKDPFANKITFAVANFESYEHTFANKVALAIANRKSYKQPIANSFAFSVANGITNCYTIVDIPSNTKVTQNDRVYEVWIFVRNDVTFENSNGCQNRLF
jgi:hypothetical protein